MASENTVLARQPTVLSMRDIVALADRLESYAKVVLSTNPAASFANDARLAGKALRVMLHAYNKYDIFDIGERDRPPVL